MCGSFPHRISLDERSSPNEPLLHLETCSAVARVRPGSNRPFIVSPWTWLIATSAGVLVAAGLVAAARKVGLIPLETGSAKTVSADDVSAPESNRPQMGSPQQPSPRFPIVSALCRPAREG